MDELTRERYGPTVPYWEAYAQPNAPPRSRSRHQPHPDVYEARRRVLDQLPPLQPAPQSEVDDDATREEAIMARALTATEVMVLTDYATTNDQVAEIAQNHGLPVSAVRGLLHRTCNFDRDQAGRLVDIACISAAELCDRAGLSYRQLDYWCRSGYLHPIGGATPGQGFARRFSRAEADIATLMARLVAAGVTVEAAHHAVRNDLELLDPAVRLVIDEGAVA